MQLKGLVLLTAVLVLISITIVGAEEKFGVKVYDGATFASTESATLKKMIYSDAAAYHTNDSITKVIEFYKKQPGLEFSPANEGGRFRKGLVEIIITNPWMVDTTGKKIQYTSITMGIKKKK